MNVAYGQSDQMAPVNPVEDVAKQIDEFKMNYQFAEVEKRIMETQRRFSGNNSLQIIHADWAYFTMDYQLADSLYADLLMKDPENIAAFNGRGLVALDNRKLETALQYVQQALETDSVHIVSWLNYAKVLLASGDSKSYINAVNKALAIDSMNSDALYNKGFYLGRYRYNIEEGAVYLKKALVSNPLNKQAHHFLGRGYSPSDYNNEDAITNKQLVAVDSLLKTSNFEKAQHLIAEEYAKDSLNIEVLKLIAATEFHLGHYHTCIDHAFSILDLKLNYGMAHYYIAESLSKLKDAHNIQIKQFIVDFKKKEIPDDIPFLEEVFINYEQCDSDLQKIIRLNCQPFNGFMEALAISGATVYFMDFHHLMWNCPYLQDTKGNRTAGLRLQDDLKGQGGYHMTSNKLQQTEAMYGRFNVAFHEFGHLIHWLFTPYQIKELKHLFIQAKKGAYTLDWYADMNEREYFAQGVEAFLSDQKLPGLPAASKNTRHDLFEQDIQLYNFIESLIHQDSYQKHIIQAYILKSRHIESIDEAITALNEALRLYPHNASLLIELGNLYRENGDYKNAIATHREAIELSAENLSAKLEWSYDIFLHTNKVEESIKLLEEVKSHQAFDSEMSVFLGWYYLTGGNYQKAIEVLQRAIDQDPFPDPYNLRIWDAYYLLGKAFLKTQAYALAEANIQKSLSINSNNAEANANMAFIKYKQTKFEDAKKYINRAMQLNPDDRRVNEVYNLLNS